MHGHIEFVPYERVAVITGRLNWATIVILVYVAYISITSVGSAAIVFVGVFLAILGVSYATQRNRYNAVAAAVREKFGDGT